MSNPLVSIIVVLFNNERFIQPLLESVSKQTYTNFEVLLIDNGSKDATKDLATQYLAKFGLREKCFYWNLGENTGFAFANNYAARKAKGQYFLFLNSDLTLQEDALFELVQAATNPSTDSRCVGWSPKIYLTSFLPEKVFDSVGICMNSSGSPFNRGIGQYDFGQYDQAVEVMGCCFASALIRAKEFLGLGGLDDSYFAYFEDVDFCFRARKSGYILASTPSAIAYHHHSATTSANAYAWKYNLIFRNYLRTATKSFGMKTAVRVVAGKLKDLLKVVLRRRDELSIRVTSLRVVLNYFLRDVWLYVFKRKKTQQHYNHRITDQYIFSFSLDEPSHFFNSTNYALENQLEMFEYIFYRKLKSCPLANDRRSSLEAAWLGLKRRYYVLDKAGREKWITEYREQLAAIGWN